MNEEERVHDARRAVGRLCDQLLAAVPIDGETLDKNSVRTLPGMYLWRFKKGKRPAYVGVALGKGGLRQRLIGQHLRPSYLKSVFREAVRKKAGVDPGEESVDFIRSRFTVAFISCPNRHRATIAAIAAAEAMVIAALQPEFNKVKGVRHSAFEPPPTQAHAAQGTGIARAGDTPDRFLLCIGNKGCEASLEVRKLYERLPDKEAERHDQVRIVDESGEDYLYPSGFFAPVRLPMQTRSRGSGNL